MNSTLAEKKYYPEKNEIQGWMLDGELMWLFHKAQQMNNVAEIGCWKGRSSHALLSGCAGDVYCIDHFEGTPSQRGDYHHEATVKLVVDDFLKNVGHFPNLKIMEMDSNEAVALFPDKSVYMIFFDGDHSFKAARQDFKVWLPKCKKLLCGHDINEVGVFAALKSLGLKFTNPVGTIWEVAL